MRLARERSVDLTVVGPEAPLVAGIVDAFTAAGLRVFGPTARAAQLEGSKLFCKQILHRGDVPTAMFREFRSAATARIMRRITEGVAILRGEQAPPDVWDHRLGRRVRVDESGGR